MILLLVNKVTAKQLSCIQLKLLLTHTHTYTHTHLCAKRTHVHTLTRPITYLTYIRLCMYTYKPTPMYVRSCAHFVICIYNISYICKWTCIMVILLPNKKQFTRWSEMLYYVILFVYANCINFAAGQFSGSTINCSICIYTHILYMYINIEYCTIAIIIIIMFWAKWRRLIRHIDPHIRVGKDAEEEEEEEEEEVLNKRLFGLLTYCNLYCMWILVIGYTLSIFVIFLQVSFLTTKTRWTLPCVPVTTPTQVTSKDECLR